jgi:hypothetical protein
MLADAGGKQPVSTVAAAEVSKAMEGPGLHHNKVHEALTLFVDHSSSLVMSSGRAAPGKTRGITPFCQPLTSASC